MSRQRNYEVYYKFSSRIKERESFSKKKKKSKEIVETKVVF